MSTSTLELIRQVLIRVSALLSGAPTSQRVTSDHSRTHSSDERKQRDAAIRPNLRSLQLREAQWVWSEMEDFVRLIQRYRGLYVTAIFASIGWLLSQVVTVSRQTPAADALQLLTQI